MARELSERVAAGQPSEARESALRRPSLSVVMIVQNEELRLERTLQSVRWADEIVIVDGGSTDRTPQIARRYTERVYSNPYPGEGAQRLHALGFATGDWILSLDADEVVSPQLRGSIQRAIRDPGQVVGFEVELRTWFLGSWLGDRGWRRERKLRLFRRDRGSFSVVAVHAGVEVRGPVGRLEGPLLHYPYHDLAHHLEKLNRYTTMMARRQHEQGKRGGVIRAVARGGGNFLKSYLLHGRFLYGRAGFMDAALAGLYGFLKYAKLWELQQTGRARAPAADAAGAQEEARR